MLLAICSLVVSSGLTVQQDTPKFFADTIRATCLTNGTDPQVFQYWFDAPIPKGQDNVLGSLYSFGADATGSINGTKGQFHYLAYFRPERSKQPTDSERTSAWSEERCKSLATDLLIALRPNTLWSLAKSEYDPDGLTAKYGFDAVVDGLPYWTTLRAVGSHDAEIQIDAISGAVNRIDLRTAAPVVPADMQKNPSDSDLMAEAQSDYNSYKPFNQCQAPMGQDYVVDPYYLQFWPHSFSRHQLDLLSAGQGLRVRVVQFDEGGTQRVARQWVVLDAKDGKCIAIVELDSQRSSSRSTQHGEDAGRKIEASKFRVSGTHSSFFEIAASDNPEIGAEAKPVLLESDKGALYTSDFDASAGVLRLRSDGRVYKVKDEFAKQLKEAVKRAERAPKFDPPKEPDGVVHAGLPGCGLASRCAFNLVLIGRSGLTWP
ncbi:MAG TPA: hypothetical protein VNI20_09875 [Fimbriimonadaceae bacterium]|nr:hypothetical protein [Fimbriimonadaceae bacterium]